MRFFILFAFALSGAAALIYEVAWTRALSLVLGSTTYALSTMLSTFMAGLAIGGFIGGRIADRAKNLLLYFGLAEFFIGLTGLLTIPLINAIPGLYVTVYRDYHLTPGVYFIFQFLLCCLVMIVPTTLMGATFPLVSKIITDTMDRMGRSVGGVYSVNTFGAILGSLSAGFLLIPLAGVKMTSLTAAGLNIVVALAMIVLARPKRLIVTVLGGLALFGMVFAGVVSSQEKAWYVNYYNAFKFEDLNNIGEYEKDHTLLYDKDHAEGRVKLWRSRQGYLTLQVGGKSEGGSPADTATTVLLAYLPIAAHEKAESLLNIGLGVGVTLTAARHHVRDVTVAEINRGVVDAIRTFGLPGLLDGTSVAINDARNYLLLTERTFDIIASEPSYPSDAGTASLFTADFYRTAKGRLNRGGIFTQWLPYHLLTNEDVTMMIRTFGSEFEHVYLWRVPHSMDLIMLGSNEPFAHGSDDIVRRVAELNVDGIPLQYEFSRTPDQIREIVRSRTDIPVNTDDRPSLEFRVAMNLIRDLD